MSESTPAESVPAVNEEGIGPSTITTGQAKDGVSPSRQATKRERSKSEDNGGKKQAKISHEKKEQKKEKKQPLYPPDNTPPPMKPGQVRVFIGNLEYSVTEDNLRDEFGKCGELAWWRIIKDRNGAARGIAFVTFVHRDGANRAIARFNGKYFHGRVLQVNVAMGREEAMDMKRKLTQEGVSGPFPPGTKPFDNRFDLPPQEAPGPIRYGAPYGAPYGASYGAVYGPISRYELPPTGRFGEDYDRAYSDRFGLPLRGVGGGGSSYRGMMESPGGAPRYPKMLDDGYMRPLDYGRDSYLDRDARDLRLDDRPYPGEGPRGMPAPAPRPYELRVANGYRGDVRFMDADLRDRGGSALEPMYDDRDRYRFGYDGYQSRESRDMPLHLRDPDGRLATVRSRDDYPPRGYRDSRDPRDLDQDYVVVLDDRGSYRGGADPAGGPSYRSNIRSGAMPPEGYRSGGGSGLDGYRGTCRSIPDDDFGSGREGYSSRAGYGGPSTRDGPLRSPPDDFGGSSSSSSRTSPRDGYALA